MGISGVKADDPNRAAWWAGHLLTTGVSSQSKSRAESLSRELAASSGAAAYAKRLAELEKIAIDVLAETPKFSPECFNFTSRDLEKKVDKLLETHAATPWVKEILAALKKETGKG